MATGAVICPEVPGTQVDAAPSVGGVSQPSGTEVFTVAGADTWSFPAGASFAIVEVIGATGGGGSGDLTGFGGGGGGGGAGYARARFEAGADIDIVVGAAGLGSAPEAAGGAGGATTVTQGTDEVEVTGGAGGAVAVGEDSGAGGAGGVASVTGGGVTPLMLVDGIAGQNGLTGNYGGRGGACAGLGQTALANGGARGMPAGGQGTDPGGGGGGGITDEGTGAAGRAGRVRISWGP